MVKAITGNFCKYVDFSSRLVTSENWAWNKLKLMISDWYSPLYDMMCIKLSSTSSVHLALHSSNCGSIYPGLVLCLIHFTLVHNALWVKSGNRGNLKCLNVNDHYELIFYRKMLISFLSDAKLLHVYDWYLGLII